MLAALPQPTNAMRSPRITPLVLLVTPFLAAFLAPPSDPAPGRASATSVARAAQDAERAAPTPPREWLRGPYEIVRVVDGDTLHVRREGRIEKLRLLSVDTEEKLGPGGAASESKPGTVFGEETSVWARELFESFAEEDGRTRVRLVIPGGDERLDVYGRLLCHVLLPDDRDFNLLLVRSGKSPYFSKYGYSEVDHGAFVEAQRLAQAEALGIWDPATNRPRTAGAPSARRPYERLLPWWEARAQALAGFQERHLAAPLAVVAADSPEALARAAAREGTEVEVFGEIDRLFDETDGSLTVLLRGSDRQRLVRVRIAADARSAHDGLDFAGRRAEYRQNFVYVRGRLRDTGRGFELRSSSPEQWSAGGPEPVFPESRAGSAVDGPGERAARDAARAVERIGVGR